MSCPRAHTNPLPLGEGTANETNRADDGFAPGVSDISAVNHSRRVDLGLGVKNNLFLKG